jgi:hypothetical protein
MHAQRHIFISTRDRLTRDPFGAGRPACVLSPLLELSYAAKAWDGKACRGGQRNRRQTDEHGFLATRGVARQAWACG